MQCPACGHTNRPNARFCGACAAVLSSTVACQGCGTENPADQRFCDSCGQILGTGPTGSRSPTPAPSAAMPASLGNGRYELLRFLGEGGRKKVYLADDTRLGREVAVSVVKTDGLEESGFARVRREAEAMGRLGDHPNIVTVYDMGEGAALPDGPAAGLFIVSQYMPGGDLEGLLNQAPDHRLSVEEVLRIGRDVAGALAHAHAHDVIHRDLKPQNVWLTQDGTAKLGDFGLAVALDRSRLTVEGTMVGTVAYMPPEQALGRPADGRSDIYALGALLYELLCGRPPFVGEDAVAVISQHIHTAPVGPSWHRPDVPRALEELVLQMLAKAPDDRPQTADDVVTTLNAIAAVASSAEPATPQEAAALERLSGGAFIGRERETRELREGLDEAISGHGRLFMIAGESGIGKTRLATELATYASLRGVQVLWGRCYEGEGAPAYWPWVQVIRAHVHERDATALSSEMGPGAADIAQVVSEVRDRLPGLPEPPPLEPEQARFRLFDAISTFLRNASAKQPLAIVLDDLHSADKPSLLLLQFLAREVRDARILVLGTYRDVELDRRHPLAEVLSTLRHERGYERVLLRGLQEEEVKRMIEAAAQHELKTTDERALVDAVHRETEGNPFFIEEVIRHLIETGGVYRREGRWVSDARRIEELGIPEGVRDVIGRRLAHLSDDTATLLSVASVIGREFRYETLEAVGDLEGELLLEALEEAVEAGILQEIAGEVGRYGFTHAVIRETLYDDIATSRRLALHRTIGEALEHFHSHSIESHLPELAYHYLEAAHAGDVDKAVDYAARAGRRSVDLYAYEEAAGHFERALQVLDVRAGNGHQRFDLLMALGDAQWRAGDVHRSKATFRQAARLARDEDDAERFAAAALGVGSGLGGFGVTDRADAALLEILGEALEWLPDTDSELRVRVLARLSVELYYTDALAERTERSRQAVEMAARLGSPKLELLALYSRHWSVLGPDDVEGQLEAATEIVRLAGLVGDREMAFRGHHFRLHSLLLMGDHAAVDAEIRSCERLAKELRQPLYVWQVTVFRAMRAMQRGRFEEAERLAQEAWQIGQRGQQEITFVTFGAQIAAIRFAQGRLEEIIDGGDAFVEQYPHSAWPAGVASMYAELGRREETQRLFERVAANGFAGMRRDGNWLASLSSLSRCAAFLGDSKHAAELYDLIAPFADRCPALQAGACPLPTNHAPLGVLATAIGRWDVAAAHFERALELTTTRDVGYWRPIVQREFARMLLVRGGDDTRERAMSLLADALDVARAQGMKRLVEQLLELKMQAQGVVAVDARTSIDAVAESVDASRPDLRPAAAPDGTVTMMFSDIEGSAAMTERLGDQRWLELLRAHNAIVRRHVRAHGGFEVKSQGDGFMLAFASARRAVKCAIAIQRAFCAYSAEHPEEPLRVRIGLHTGEAIRDQDDFFGRTVVLAARIGAVARGGETVVSSLLRELTASTGEFAFDNGRDVELKGLAGTHRVYAVEGQVTGNGNGAAQSGGEQADRART